MTPRQMAAYLFLNGQRRIRESANELTVNFMAARADPKAVNEQLDKWEYDL